MNEPKPKNTGHFRIVPSCKSIDSRQVVTIREARKIFKKRLEDALETAKAGDILLVRAGTSIGKTHTMRAYLRDLNKRAVLFVPTHRVGQDEYEKAKLPDAKRLKSFEQLNKEGELDCPSKGKIEERKKQGFEFKRTICSTCPRYSPSARCPLYRQFDEVAKAPYRILTHAHLELPKEKLENLASGVDFVIFDECFLDWVNREEVIKVQDLEHLLKLLQSLPDQTHTTVPITGVQSLLTELGKQNPPAHYDLTKYEFSKFLGRDLAALGPVKGADSRRNVFPTLVKACESGSSLIIRPIPVGNYWRREAVLSRHNEIPAHVPVVILDATGEKEIYERILGKPVIEVHLDEIKVKRHAKIVQDLRRTYNASSLFVNDTAPAKERLSKEEFHAAKALGLSQRPAEDILTSVAYDLFTQIGPRIEDESQCLFISTLRLEPFLKAAFPLAHFAHFMDLKSRNELQDFRQYFIVGYPAHPDYDLAKSACLMFGLKDMLFKDRAGEARLRKKTGKRQFAHICDRKNGCCYEIEDACLPDEDFAAFWRTKIRGEMIQAVGRARPEVPKTFAQTIYIYSSIALPIEVDEFIVPAGDFVQSRFPALKARAQELLSVFDEIGIEDLVTDTFPLRTVRRHLPQLEAALDLKSRKVGPTRSKTVWDFRKRTAWHSLIVEPKPPRKQKPKSEKSVKAKSLECGKEINSANFPGQTAKCRACS